MMNDNDTSVIETKFLRCSKCRSYSVRSTELNTIEKIKGFLFPAAAYFCENCSHRFVEYGRFSPGFKNLLFQYKWLLAVPLVAAALVIAVLFLPGDKSLQPPDSTPRSETPVKKREVPSNVDQIDRSTETERTGKVTIEEKTEPKPIQKGEGEKEKPKAVTSPVILNKTESIRTSIKVFSATTIKVRSSAPNTVSPAYKWSFRKKTITIKREVHQHVYVAGDSTGTQKWAVDDQLIINGKVYEGLSASYNNKGGSLPETAKRQPLDITNLVPPDKQTPLNIELVDHGKFWANTEIHIVVK